MVLVGKKAPNFKAKAVINGKIEQDFTLAQFLGKKYAIFFFYPKDFTFVCPTEILAFQKMLPEFEKRDAQIVGCSTDSEYSHLAWQNTPTDKGGIMGVAYPIVSDINKTIASSYGVLAGGIARRADGVETVSGEMIAYRGLFLIDKEGVVRHEVVNDFPLGRSTDEALRILDALRHYEKYGEVCPMNWREGSPAISV